MSYDSGYTTKNNRVATLLRKAGYIPLPRLWVRPEDMPAIHQIAHRHQTAVNDIRATAYDGHYTNEQLDSYPPITEVNSANPKLDKEAAWSAYEALQRSR
jgi:hypothetical protein